MSVPRPVLIAAIITLFATGCGSSTPSSSPGSTSAAPSATPTTVPAPSQPSTPPVAPEPTAPLATEVLQSVPGPLLDPSGLAAAGDTVLVLDVRSPDAYAAGNIQGAINLPIEAFNAPSADDVAFQLADLESGAALLGSVGIGPDTTVVIYDGDMGVYAARAYFALKYWGHDAVQLLDGSLAGWIADGFPVSTDLTAPVPTDHPVAASPGANRLLFDDVDTARDSEVAFLDARAPDEYDGTTVFGGETGGHIPGATNFEWTEALDADGFFKTDDELKQLYADAGFLHNGPVITYCYIGVRASHSWFVLSELLGYPDVGMYDGSWAEYGTVDGAEISG